ncbi:hypothetical protein GCK72_011016 [Caenorhabditis remanei]|uniref:Uncharacterized protein n=1 Tax=Caenorhabditis remanei TaxID=31234 RepID=A0A6A5H7I8_CAERE|nr:hypothetical protein GCK72_011016 [Caenorhabditis remanei]KAF1762754.1 hypothetical protein GCK72_011016 [Caenorhabditis remanei]
MWHGNEKSPSKKPTSSRPLHPFRMSAMSPIKMRPDGKDRASVGPLSKPPTTLAITPLTVPPTSRREPPLTVRASQKNSRGNTIASSSTSTVSNRIKRCRQIPKRYRNAESEEAAIRSRHLQNLAARSTILYRRFQATVVAVATIPAVATTPAVTPKPRPFSLFCIQILDFGDDFTIIEQHSSAPYS